MPIKLQGIEETWIEIAFLYHDPIPDEGSLLAVRFFKNNRLDRINEFGWTNETVRSLAQMLQQFPMDKYEGYFSHYEKTFEMEWLHESETNLYLLIIRDNGLLFTMKVTAEHIQAFGHAVEAGIQTAQTISRRRPQTPITLPASDGILSITYLHHNPVESDVSQVRVAYYQNDKNEFTHDVDWPNSTLFAFIDFLQQFPTEEQSLSGIYSLGEHNFKWRWMQEYDTNMYLIIIEYSGRLFTLKATPNNLNRFGRLLEIGTWEDSNI